MADRMTSRDDYHLQFINTTYTEDFDVDVNSFLRKIYPARAPLQCVRHESSTSNDKQAILVRFELSAAGRNAGITLEAAGRELCQRVLQKSSRRYLGLVTSESILGVSPVSRTWKQYFSRSFFTASLSQGPVLLQDIGQTFKDKYLPSWALVLSFAVLAGLNFSVFVDGPIEEKAITELMGVAGAGFAADILKRFTVVRTSRPRDELEREWRTDHELFKGHITAVVDALKLYTDSSRLRRPLLANGGSGGAILTDSSPAEVLCEALYNIAESAARVNTTNLEVLKAFRDARTQAENQIALKGAGVGLSLWAVGSAFWTTTTISSSILPLASWGLGEVIGLALFAELPVVVTTTTTLWWCPPLALAAGVGAIACTVAAYKKNKERKKFNQRVLYHEAMKNFIVNAWGQAYDTEQFLLWVCCTNASNPRDVEFISDAARKKWSDFIQSVRNAAGQEATAEELSARFVLKYLDMQRGTLTKMRAALAEADKKLEEIS